MTCATIGPDPYIQPFKVGATSRAETTITR